VQANPLISGTSQSPYTGYTARAGLLARRIPPHGSGLRLPNPGRSVGRARACVPAFV